MTVQIERTKQGIEPNIKYVPEGSYAFCNIFSMTLKGNCATLGPAKRPNKCV